MGPGLLISPIPGVEHPGGLPKDWWMYCFPNCVRLHGWGRFQDHVIQAAAETVVAGEVLVVGHLEKD